MKKHTIIIGIAIVLFLMDLALTLFYINNYYYLVSEGNTLVNIRQGYLMLVINGIYFIVISIIAIIYSRYETIIINSRNTFDYIKKLFLSNHNNFIIINGFFVLILGSFASRITAIIDWIVFGIYRENFFFTNYAKIRAEMPFERYDIIIGFIVGFIASPLWYYFEHKKSVKILSHIQE